MALPLPWSLLEDEIGRTQNYADGSRRLADFFKGLEESHNAMDLMHALWASHASEKWWERFLFSLLNISPSDRQVGDRALAGRRMRRLLCRSEVRGTLTEPERILSERLCLMFQPVGNVGLQAALKRARLMFRRAIESHSLTQEERQYLALLIRTEAECLKERVNWLSENADPYNMKVMSRVLPRLRIYDEAVHEGLDLAKKIEAGDEVGLPMLSFEWEMKGPVFEKWRTGIGHSPRLVKIAELVDMQREKRVATMDLIALSTVQRWIFELKGQKTHPVDWVLRALHATDGEAISFDAGEIGSTLLSRVANSGFSLLGTRLSGHIQSGSFPELIGRDLATRPLDRKEEEGLLDVKTLILQNITRDSIIETLLSNAKFYSSPGLVATIATLTRSVVILSKIAKYRHLHTGFANRDVPMALITSPCNIPVNLVRPFISTKFVSMAELRRLVKQRGGLRREVRLMVEQFVLGR